MKIVVFVACQGGKIKMKEINMAMLVRPVCKNCGAWLQPKSRSNKTYVHEATFKIQCSDGADASPFMITVRKSY